MGRKSKTVGDAFENILVNTARRSDIVPIRIPNAGRAIQTYMGLKWIKQRSPFDFVFVKNGKSIFFDAKTVGAKTFSRSMLTPHQVKALLDVSHHATAGYLIYFRPVNRVVFFKAMDLWRVLMGDILKLNCESGLVIGGIEDMNFDLIFSLWPLNP